MMLLTFTFCMQMFGGYADLVYQFGMADENQRDYIQKVSDQAVQLITSGDFLGAFKVHALRREEGGRGVYGFVE